MRIFILYLILSKPTPLGYYATMELCQAAQKIGEAQTPHISRGRFICLPAGTHP